LRITQIGKFYPDAEEEIPNNLPISKGPKVQMSIYVDADHAHDLVKRRSIHNTLSMGYYD
jgi:hypothetical protein